MPMLHWHALQQWCTYLVGAEGDEAPAKQAACHILTPQVGQVGPMEALRSLWRRLCQCLLGLSCPALPQQGDIGAVCRRGSCTGSGGNAESMHDLCLSCRRFVPESFQLHALHVEAEV